MMSTILPASDRNGQIAARCVGCGPPLVLIHGVGLQAQAWDEMTSDLCAAFTVYAIDMPGHGHSPLDGAATLDDFVARVDDFVTALGSPVRVAGHSMGAMIALEIAARHPDKVLGVAALNGIYRRSPEAAAAVQARAAALPDAGVSDPTDTLTRWFGDAPQGTAARARDACHDWLTQVNPAGYKAAYTVFAHADGPSDAALRNLVCPGVFLTGAGDPNSTPTMSSAMAKLAPKGRAVILDGAAHMLPMTHAKEAAETLIAVFADGHPPEKGA